MTCQRCGKGEAWYWVYDLPDAETQPTESCLACAIVGAKLGLRVTQIVPGYCFWPQKKGEPEEMP